MSAASFLGISAMVFTNGYDGLIYSTGFLVGLSLVLFLIAERLRNLGKFTFADAGHPTVLPKPLYGFLRRLVRWLLCYYIWLLKWSGQVKPLTMFGLDYIWAVVIVGVLMVAYVIWRYVGNHMVQIIKAVMLLSGATFMALMVLYAADFSPEKMFTTATQIHSKGNAIMGPGALVSNPIDALSLGLALMCVRQVYRIFWCVFSPCQMPKKPVNRC